MEITSVLGKSGFFCGELVGNLNLLLFPIINLL